MSFSRIQACDADDGFSETITNSGTTVDATPVNPFPSLACNGGQSRTGSEVWYTFAAGGKNTNITIDNITMTGVQLVVYLGPDCDNLQAQACALGNGGASVDLFTSPGQQVYFFVAGLDAADQGTFDISVTSSTLCGACFQGDNGFITLSPLNATGVYACGAAVDVCFTLTEWEGNASGTVEWLHSIVPTFGPGWDVPTISNISTPGSCDNRGTWRYYPAGWTSCNTGAVFEQGFAYNSNQGVNNACPEGTFGPGNNFGDGANGCVNYPTPTQWCWTMNVRQCPPDSDTFTGEDMSITVAIYSDGDAGSWTQTGCNSGATFDVLASVVVCSDEDPIAFSTPLSCPNADDGTITADAQNGIDPTGTYNFTLRNESGVAVFVCNGCTGQQVITGLPAGDYNFEALNLSNSCPRSVVVTVDDTTAPEAIPDFTQACPGTGPMQLTGSTTFLGTVFEYDWTGPNGFISTAQNPLTNDPADEGVYTLIVTVDGCAGEPVDITVEYIDFDPQVSAANTSLCFGADVELEVTNGGTDFQWYDENGDLAGTNSPTLTQAVMSEGLVTFSVDVTDGNGCTINLPIDINVENQIFADIEMTNGGMTCKAADPADPDIEFFLLQPGMNAFPAGWTFDWDNGASFTDSYQLFDVTPGTYTVSVVATSPGGCTETFTADYTIFELPTVSITPTAPAVCTGGDVTLTANAADGDGTYFYSWVSEGVEVGTDPTLQLDNLSFSVVDIYVQVTDGNGCIGFSQFVTIDVLDAPTQVTFADCTDPAPNAGEIEFNWDNVGQTHFEIYTRIGAGPEMLIDDNYMGTSYNTGVLPPGTSVTITVIPISGSGTTICPGPDSRFTCSNQACENPGWQHTTITDVCVSSDDQAFEFMLGTTIPGTITLNSATLNLTNLPADVDGSTTVLLPALADGTSGFTHQIMASYVDAMGGCPFDTTFNLPVVRVGNPEISIADNDICAASTDVVFSLVNAFDANSAYVLSIADPSGTTIINEDPAGGSWTVNFTEFRTHQITLTTTQNANAGCTDSFTLPFTLSRPPVAPTVVCGATGLDFVEFEWADVGADSYTVTEVSIPAGATGMQTALGYRVTGLNTDASVTITVTAVVAGCADVTSAEVTCVAQSCPTFPLTITTPTDPLCVDGSNGLIDLTVTTPGAGTVAWSGPGVTGNQFDPAAAGSGPHTITVVYTEGTCSTPASFMLTVNDPPATAFSFSDDPICVGGSTTLTYDGDATGLTFSWSMPNGTPNTGTGPGPIDVSFAASGSQDVTLTVTSASCTATGTQSVTVEDPPVPPTVMCQNENFDQVGFAWSHPTATDFLVTVVSQPAGAMMTENGNSMLFTGLAEGESVEISVIAVGTGPCGNSMPATQTCMTRMCPAISIAVDQLGTYCADEDVDVTLVATVMGSDGSGVLSWMGSDGSMTGSFNPSTLTPGMYTFTASFLEADCTFSAFTQIEVIAPPSSVFDLPDGPICTDTEILGAVAGAEIAGWSYDWSSTAAVVTPGNDEASRNFSWSAPGRYFVSLTVTDDNGCAGITHTDSVDVIAPLLTPVVTCDTVTMESVTFTWTTQAGVDSFMVSVDGGTPFFQDSTTLFVDGLSVNQGVNIMVTPLSVSPCPAATAGTATCTTVACPSLQLAQPMALDICEGEMDPRTLLTTTVMGDMGGGTMTFSGPGVVQVGPDFFFDASVAGVGPHQLTVDFVEGMCMAQRTFIYTVIEKPTADFNVNGLTSGIELCVGEVFTLTYTGNITAADSADFCYVYLEQTPEPIDTIGFQTYTCSYTQPGPFRICLVVKNDGCQSDTLYVDGFCVAPIPPPTVVCESATLNSVTFSWNDVGSADGYTVTRDNGDSEVTFNTTITYDGLTPGEEVTIEVMVNDNSACGPGDLSNSITCSALPCPNFDVDLSSIPDQICILDGTETIDLSTAIITGGTELGTYSFFGTGVSGTTFDAAGVPADEAGTVYTIDLEYEEEGPCSISGSFDITVFARPTAFLTDPGDQCLGDTMTITVGSTNFVANADITVDFDGGTLVPDGNPDDATYMVFFTTPGTKNITATVVSNISGCPSAEAVLQVEVSEPLSAMNVTCVNPDLEVVTFSWDPVPGATGYEGTDENGIPFTLDAATTELSFANLSPGSSFSITIFATGDDPCGNGPAVTTSCETLPCPPGVIQATTPAQEICLDGTETAIPLTAELTEGDINGTVIWMGTGVTDTGMGFIFDPASLPPGQYPLTVSYDGPANCDSEDQVVITLFEVPVISFNTIPDQLCQGEEFNVFFTGSVPDGAILNWFFDGAVVTELGNESYLLRWDTPGGKTVTLDIDGNCPASGSFSIPVVPTLDAPVPACVSQDLDGVLFEWPAVAEATVGYRISINGGPFGDPQTETSFMVSDLAFGESVSISVISVRSGTTCDESVPSPAVDCAARVCPDVTMAPAAAQTIFCDTETDPVLLSANLSGDDGTGVLEWTGNGVVFADGNWTFDPELAGVGSHTLSISYTQETLCTYDGTMEMTINATPSIVLGSSADLTCTSTDVTVGVEGADPETTYTWDYDGASVTDRGNENYDLSWSAAGTYTVSVMASSNGCTNVSATDITVEGTVDAGTPVTGVLELCVSTTEPIDLSQRVTGAMPGGTWSAVSGGVPNGSLDAATGILNPVGLSVGDYTFAYTVAGGACPDDNAEVALRLLGAPVADAGDDQRLTCNMGMVSLNGSNSETGEGYTYLWTSDNPSNVIMDADRMMIDVSQPGIYTLRVTNAIGCSATSDVVVTAETEAPVMEIQLSQITCFATDNGAVSVTNVSGGRPPYTFTLNGEDRGQSTLFAGLQPAEYDLQVTDANGCFSNIIVDITEPNELTVNLRFPGDSTTANAGDNVFISATINGGNPIDTLIWEPDSLITTDGQNGISLIADETRMISVTVVDELGCTASDQMMLLVRRDRPVYFPTAFSPNGDNINDIFFIGGDLDQIDFIDNFFIFDRWGEALYEGGQVNVGGDPVGGPGNPTTDGTGFLPNDPAFGWDGRLNGKFLNPQVLVYTATVHFSDGEVIVYKGDFVLLR